jgi:peroxiredoxin
VILQNAPAWRGASLGKLAAVAAALAIAAGVLFAPLTARSDTVSLKPWHERTPPDFALPTVDGGEARLDAQRGRIVLVHFFATWCEPCREELPALRRLVARAEPGSIAVLAISVAEVESRVRRFLELTPVNFPVLLDQDRAVTKAWSVSALPATVIFDTNLKPRLAAKADFGWNGIEPATLIGMLKPETTKQTITSSHNGGLR